MKIVKLTDLGNGREVTLSNERSKIVIKEIRRVSGSIWRTIFWLLFSFVLRKKYAGLLNKVAPGIKIEIENNSSTRIYHVYSRSILLDQASRPMQFYMGLLLEEWLQP